MELRHLRCFLAVAEELHFARAAVRLHIEQSPLSRTIKELEEILGEQLFVRTSRSTRLTRAGKLFLEHVPRVFTAVQQARDSVKAATNGFHGQLRIALSDGITPSRLPALLAMCRQEEPEIDIRLFEVPLTQQIKGLHEDLYDVGFAQSDEVGEGITAESVWSDLERLTKRCEMANANDAASQRKQRDMNIDATFEASAQLAEGSQPSVGALHHPAMTPEPVIALDTTPGNTRRDAQLAQVGSATRKVIALVGMQLVGPTSGPATTASHRGQGID
ncbi:LysR substrate binding domain-containing protein, partial [Paracidovorax konjaci]